MVATSSVSDDDDRLGPTHHCRRGGVFVAGNNYNTGSSSSQQQQQLDDVVNGLEVVDVAASKRSAWCKAVHLLEMIFLSKVVRIDEQE